MSKREHEPVVRVICTDRRHEGTPEFARQGHHYLTSVQPRRRPGGLVTLFAKPKPAKGLPHDEITEFADDGTWPFSAFHRADGVPIFHAKCQGCGRDVQAEEPRVVEYIRRLDEGCPADTTRLFLDIVALESHLAA